MEDSILISTKKILGVSEEYLAFDLDIITHINAAFSILNQLGVGPTEGFFIEDDSATWSQFVVPPEQGHLVKTYVYLKVRMLFDPPTTSFLIEAMNEQIKQYEWRLNVFREVENYPLEGLEEASREYYSQRFTRQPTTNRKSGMGIRRSS